MSITPDPAVGYRWYTVGLGVIFGQFWMKIGPVSISVYRWTDGWWRVELHLLGRWSVPFPALS